LRRRWTNCCGVKRTSHCSRASRPPSATLVDIEQQEAAVHLAREEVHRLEKQRDDEATDDEDEEVEEASWWRT
jgi:hypothetical protein